MFDSKRFLDAVKEYRSSSVTKLPDYGQKIWEEYLDSEILNVDSQAMSSCRVNINKAIYNYWTFDEVAVSMSYAFSLRKKFK